MAAEFFTFYQLNNGTQVVREQFTNGVDTVGDFQAKNFERTEINVGGELGGNETTLTFSVTDEFAKSRMVNRQEERYWVAIRVAHDSADPFWQGKMRSVNPSHNTIQIVFTSKLSAARIYGLPVQFQRTCRHALYDSGCQVPRPGRSRAITVNQTDGRYNAIAVTLGAYSGTLAWPLARALFGYIEQGTRRYRIERIDERSGGVVVILLNNIIQLERGAATMWMGCNKTVADCTYYNNLTNFGGFPYLPTTDLWGQDQVKYRGVADEFN